MHIHRHRVLNLGMSELTPYEISQGWHFCWEYDGLLVGPGCPELMECECLPKDHQAYLCIPCRDKVPCPIKFWEERAKSNLTSP
jgi:hypothetical protein